MSQAGQIRPAASGSPWTFAARPVNPRFQTRPGGSADDGSVPILLQKSLGTCFTCGVLSTDRILVPVGFIRGIVFLKTPPSERLLLGSLAGLLQHNLPPADVSGCNKLRLLTLDLSDHLSARAMNVPGTLRPSAFFKFNDELELHRLDDRRLGRPSFENSTGVHTRCRRLQPSAQKELELGP
jgi:hypothetical protein